MSVHEKEASAGKRPWWRRRWLLNTVGLLLALAAIVAALAFWASSGQFQELVRHRLESELHNATGGRVEIASLQWRLLRLEAEAGGIVIHGDEPAPEAPYAQIERLRVRVSILGFWWSPRILLRDLEITRPRMHLILYPDGATNQPHPAKPANPKRPVMDTLFDLEAGHVAVEQGLMDIDNRAEEALDVQHRYQPLDFRGDDVSLAIRYTPAAGKTPESYRIDTGVRDFSLTRGGTLEKTPDVHGIAQAQVDLMRDSVSLRSLHLAARGKGMADRNLDISGALTHFARPQWQARVNGEVDLRLLDRVLGYPFAPEGIARLNLTSGGSGGEFRVDGSVRAQKASYIGPGVTARGIDLSMQVHADSRELRISSIVARLAQGGEIDGDLVLDHWLPLQPSAVQMRADTESPRVHESLRQRLSRHQHPHPDQAPEPPAPVAKQAPPHSTLVKSPNIPILVNGKVNAVFKDITVDTILDIVSQPPYQRLGIQARLNGPATAVWTNGDVQTLTVSSTLSLVSGRPIAGENPATGTIDATYRQRDGSVDLRSLALNLPQSRFLAHGRLGVFPLTGPTSIAVDFHSGDLSEFDSVLRSLGVSRNGKSGAAALPVSLQGQADFDGTWAGSLASPHLDGQLHATGIAMELPPDFRDRSGGPQVLRWDSIEAAGSYDSQRISIAHARLKHGVAVISVDGTLTAAAPAAQAGPRRGAKGGPPPASVPVLNSDAVLSIRANASEVEAADLLALMNADIPITGLLDAQINIDGPVHSPGGSGTLRLTKAEVYGEPVTSVHAEGSLAGRVVRIASGTAETPAGVVRASGTYDLQARRFDLAADGNDIELEGIQHLRDSLGEVAGRLGFHLTAVGTADDPNVGGHATVTGLTARGQSLGTVDVKGQTADHALNFEAAAHYGTAELSAQGRTELHDPWQTESKINFAQFDIATLFKVAHIEGIASESALSGSAQVAGPLAHPHAMRGDLRLQQMAVTIAGVRLQSEGGVHAALDNSRLLLDPVHITGEHTDLRAQGTLGLDGTQPIDFASNGSIDLKLLETLDSDVTASGISKFQLEVRGPLANPDFRGRIDFDNGAIALEDVPNGLSQLKGTLEFNQNRLEVRSLTAMTGGGQLTVGGYLAYQKGIYANLSVTGRSVRIRYPAGVSSQADANLQLQGSQNSLLLSGNVLITRFSVSPDLDFAALAAQASAAHPIPSPNAPSNHVRLDVRIQSSPQLNFQNSFAKLAGDVDLRLRGTLASPSLLGRISVTEGSATIAGTRYELQRGDITFTNPIRIQPNIDLNATARVEDYDITLGLHGTPDKMNVSYRSDPPLPQADVVALLALGRTQSEQGIYTQQQQEAAGSQNTDVLLGGALNATVSSRVEKLFGAGSVKVDPSYLTGLGNSTTRITVEEQLGKYVTITYATNVDTTAQQLLQADIAINRHVSLQVTRDESGVFSMVVKAVRRYR